MSENQILDQESAERAIVAFLKEPDSETDLVGVDIEAASNREARVGPTHIFVMCRELKHQGHGVYVADIAVTLVTNIDDTSNVERRVLRAKLAKRLSAEKEWRNFVDTDNWVRCHGWFVGGPNEVVEEGNDAVGDVFSLAVGLSRASEDDSD